MFMSSLVQYLCSYLQQATNEKMSKADSIVFLYKAHVIINVGMI